VRVERTILVFADAEEDSGSLNGFGFPVPPSPFLALRGLLSAVSAVIFAATQAANIDNHGNNQDDEVQARGGLAGIGHPGVGQGGQRQEEEADQGDEEAVIGALEIVREEEEQQQGDSWERNE
jgi:hypothetical protein